MRWTVAKLVDRTWSPRRTTEEGIAAISRTHRIAVIPGDGIDADSYATQGHWNVCAVRRRCEAPVVNLGSQLQGFKIRTVWVRVPVRARCSPSRGQNG